MIKGDHMSNRLRNWKIRTAALLVFFSAVAYLVHYAVFHDSRDIFFYMIMDIAFLPVQVMLVTFIISSLLNEREKRMLMKKLNMLIGGFYSEVGTELIRHCSGFCPDLSQVRPHLLVTPDWSDKDFLKAMRHVHSAELSLDSRKADLHGVRDFLEMRRGFMLGLLSNPNLHEHETLSDLLWAVLHLSEELSARPSLSGLPRADYEHLSGDLKRAYSKLLCEWLGYVRHLRRDYPYLFSLAVRLNPLDAGASAVVEK
jgi:hypothetical protein